MSTDAGTPKCISAERLDQLVEYAMDCTLGEAHKMACELTALRTAHEAAQAEIIEARQIQDRQAEEIIEITRQLSELQERFSRLGAET